MPEPPPRNRLQLHLSTAIVLMFASGAFIWANLTEWNLVDSTFPLSVYNRRGFPFTAIGTVRDEYARDASEIGFYLGPPDLSPNTRTIYNYKMLGVNVSIALVCLLIVCILHEWIIRAPGKRFQIHLLTSLLLIFATSALLRANLAERLRSTPDDPRSIPFWQSTWRWDEPYFYICRGWPLDFTRRESVDEIYQWDTPPQRGYLNGALNILTAALLLFMVWFLCEWLIRRLTSRKKD